MESVRSQGQGVGGDLGSAFQSLGPSMALIRTRAHPLPPHLPENLSTQRWDTHPSILSTLDLSSPSQETF